jgi:hypothetical protein
MVKASTVFVSPETKYTKKDGRQASKKKAFIHSFQCFFDLCIASLLSFLLDTMA